MPNIVSVSSPGGGGQAVPKFSELKLCTDYHNRIRNPISSRADLDRFIGIEYDELFMLVKKISDDLLYMVGHISAGATINAGERVFKLPVSEQITVNRTFFIAQPVNVGSSSFFRFELGANSGDVITQWGIPQVASLQAHGFIPLDTAVGGSTVGPRTYLFYSPGTENPTEIPEDNISSLIFSPQTINLPFYNLSALNARLIVAQPQDQDDPSFMWNGGMTTLFSKQADTIDFNGVTYEFWRTHNYLVNYNLWRPLNRVTLVR